METEKQTILVVDDDASVREALAHVLRFENLNVVVAASSAEALREYLRQKIDLALLDLNLSREPQECGWDLLRDLHEISPSLPILVMSGFPDQFVHAEASHAVALLEKPLDFSVLFDKLRHLFNPLARTVAA